MCGIGGILKRDENINFDEVVDLAGDLEKRGQDACGFILLNKYGDVIRMFKLPAAITEVFIELEEFLRPIIEKASAILIHTRAATFGSPRNNKNNHPFRIDNYYFAHNGYCVRTPAAIWKNKEIQTDSFNGIFEPLVTELKKRKKFAEVIDNIYRKYSACGSFWLYNSETKQLILYCHTMPLTYEYSEKEFRFASTGFSHALASFDILEIALPYSGQMRADVAQRQDDFNDIKIRPHHEYVKALSEFK